MAWELLPPVSSREQKWGSWEVGGSRASWKLQLSLSGPLPSAPHSPPQPPGLKALGRVSRKKEVACSHVHLLSACFRGASPGPGLQGHSSRLPRVSERGPDRGSTPSGGGFPSCAPLAECCSVRGHACSSRSLQGVGIPSSPNYNLSEGRDCVLLFISSCPQRMVVYIWYLIHTSVRPID